MVHVDGEVICRRKICQLYRKFSRDVALRARERGRGSTTCTEPEAIESFKLDKEVFSWPQTVEIVKETGCYAYKLEGEK